jgi:hypothetical protein
VTIAEPVTNRDHVEVHPERIFTSASAPPSIRPIVERTAEGSVLVDYQAIPIGYAVLYELEGHPVLALRTSADTVEFFSIPSEGNGAATAP